MLTPLVAAIILLITSVLLLIIIPMLDGSNKFHKFISLRYTLVALSLIMALGCILDFSHLGESSRNIVLTGGMILVGVFVLVRSIEKLKLGNKVINVSAEKGDIKLSANIHNKGPAETEDENNDQLSTNGKHLICENNNCIERITENETVECCDPDNDVSDE
jgi:uncharacterized protein YebE (UPF0316 family)